VATLLVTANVDRLAAPSPAWREAANSAPAAAHAALFADSACLDRVERRHAQPVEEAPAALRVVSWNAERLKHVEASAALLARLEADVVLLTEVDRGMARSGNRDTVGDLARLLGMGWVFGVEFVELGLGDSRERAWHGGETNRDGLHGNAILSRLPIDRAGMVRLETDGFWFMGERNGERRIGGRQAVLASIAGITFAAVHLESHSDPQHRATQTAVLLDDVEAFAAAEPIVIGGDFNTATVEHGAKGGLAAERLLDPVPFEPLFEVMAARGLAWEEANTMGVATQRSRPDGTPAPPFGRIDWLFTRGLAARSPATIPAQDDDGAAISDHEVLALTVDGG
jgi:endonuclease/exonuclease/phosphatase family metal-dependent hydrolase